MILGLSYTALIISLIAFSIAMLGVYDILQKKHTIWHNYPLIGHIRYLCEAIAPEIRQYFIENNREGLPFNRSQRRYVYASAKKENYNEGFGTDKDFNEQNHFFINSALFPIKNDKPDVSALKTIGKRRLKPYKPKSFVNISGMSFGALSGVAVESMNKGALLANCFQGTGEGGFSSYHNQGGDVVFQFGTGYNGVRNDDGTFSIHKLIDLVDKNDCIKMIEIKLHQGAKPGAWSILPKEKMTQEIREVRGIKIGDSISPGYHTAFTNAMELVEFAELIADVTQLPVGIKCGVGNLDQWYELADAIKRTERGPDYIVIDGGEGGTGSAKGSFVDHVGLPFIEAFSSVYKIFQSYGIEKDIFWIGSGKLGFPAKIVLAMSLGCDSVNIGRESMLSIGCIQAQQCHLNTCPSGVATQNKWRQHGLDPTLKSVRFANYIHQLQKDTLEIAAASGFTHPSQYNTYDIMINGGDSKGLISLNDVYGYCKKNPIKEKEEITCA